MTDWWCKFISIFVISTCTSINSEMLAVHYKPNDRVKITVEMSNIGTKASSYLMALSSKDGLRPLKNTSGIIENTSKPVSPEFTTILNEGYNNSILYVQLIRSANTCCGMQRIAIFLVKQHGRDSAKADPCTTLTGCTKKIDWHDACDGTNVNSVCVPLSQIDELAPQVDEVKKNEIVTPHIDNLAIKIQQSNWKTQQTGGLDRRFVEGDEEAFTCITDFTGYQLQWRHMKDKYIISSVMGNKESSLTLTLTMTRFDNATSIYCAVLDYNKSNARELARSHEITFTWNSQGVQKPMQYNELMVEPKPNDVIYFNKGEHVEYNCHSKNLLRKSWLRIKDYTIDTKFPSHEYKNGTQFILPLNLSESDNGASYVCQGFTFDRERNDLHMYSRILSKRINFVLNGTDGPKPDPVADNNQSNEPESFDGGGDPCFFCGRTLVYFGMGAGIIFVVILFVAAWACLKKKRPRMTPLEVETYACPRAVQYVDLQTTSTNNRIFNRNDTPYARIVGVLEPDTESSKKPIR